MEELERKTKEREPMRSRRARLHAGTERPEQPVDSSVHPDQPRDLSVRPQQPDERGTGEWRAS